MKKYERVQEILSNASGGAHPFHGGEGRFWEKSLEDFKQTVVYQRQLIAAPGPDRGARSNLIKALRGEAPFNDSVFNRMPSGLPPVAPEDIQFIQSWIDADLPDEDMEGAQGPAAESPPAPSTDGGSNEPPVRTGHTNTARNASDQPRVRKDINKLTPEELANYKSAISQAKALPDNDERSFGYWSHIHGTRCRHGNQIFLPWHRAYLIDFENVLRQFVPSVTIPYWDWVNDREIPDAFLGDETNPLFHAERYPATPGFSFMPTKQEWDDTQEARTWEIYGGTEFRKGMNERVTHDPMHGWIGGPGGDISVPFTAANDPIFWSFHCGVDRQWDLWQKLNTGVGPTTQLDTVLQPFHWEVHHVLTVEQLNYEYVSSEALVRLDATQPHNEIFIEGDNAAQSPVVASSITRIKRPKHVRGLASVQFHQVRHPKDTYTVYVFVNQANAGPDTPIEDNPHYAGRFTIWGHGECYGGKGHCDVYESYRQSQYWHHLAPFDIEHDISECVQRLEAYGQPINVNLVVKAYQNLNEDREGLKCRQVSVLTRS